MRELVKVGIISLAQIEMITQFQFQSVIFFNVQYRMYNIQNNDYFISTGMYLSYLYLN